MYAVMMGRMQRTKSLELLTGSNLTRDQLVNSTVHAPLACMSVTDGHVEVMYIKGHTSLELGVCELPHLSIPASIRDAVAMKIGLRIPAERNGK